MIGESAYDKPGFLQARLAAAAAIPVERRSSDVSAFLESCRLQREVADALVLPASLSGTSDAAVDLRPSSQVCAVGIR